MVVGGEQKGPDGLGISGSEGLRGEKGGIMLEAGKKMLQQENNEHLRIFCLIYLFTNCLSHSIKD